MKQAGTDIIRYLAKMFRTVPDPRITDAINLRNIKNIYVFSSIACIFDTFSLVLFAMTKQDSPRFRQVFFNVSCCIFACIIVILLSRAMLRKYKKGGSISAFRAAALVIIFYIVLSVWSISVDTEHYLAGEQMLTFYIVQFCFVCFVVMPPRTGSIMIALSFAALYLRIFQADGAASIQPQNYFIFAVIAVSGNTIRHMILQESEKQKVEILELNEILRQQALTDDLTKLKNRNALRSDFAGYIGKSTYVIMADVDHFKLYNDTYGHTTGDRMLQLVADATAATFADGGTYRYGGDEFLILLGSCSADAFNEKMEQWENAIRSVQIANVPHTVTCSCGYVKCLLQNADDLRKAIKAADRRLYESKKQDKSPF